MHLFTNNFSVSSTTWHYKQQNWRFQTYMDSSSGWAMTSKTFLFRRALPENKRGKRKLREKNKIRHKIESKPWFSKKSKRKKRPYHFAWNVWWKGCGRGWKFWLEKQSKEKGEKQWWEWRPWRLNLQQSRMSGENAKHVATRVARGNQNECWKCKFW